MRLPGTGVNGAERRLRHEVARGLLLGRARETFGKGNAIPCSDAFIRTQGWSQAKTDVGDCVNPQSHQSGSRLAPPRVLTTDWRQLAPGFSASDRDEDSD
jgi:hypothetical protein